MDIERLRKSFMCVLLLLLSIFTFFLVEHNRGIERKEPADSEIKREDVCAEDSFIESDSADVENCLDKKQNTDESLDFFGKWVIDKVAVISELYTGTTKDGLAEENLYDAEDFIGLSLEYREDRIIIGDCEYKKPKYKIRKNTVSEFDIGGGRFRCPDLYSFFEENNIQLFKDEVNVVLIRFPYEASYPPYNFIPVGDDIVIINDDYMFVGIWGKILLAHKISD